MKTIALLILFSFTTLAIAQEDTIASLTVGGIQKRYESEGQKALTQKAFQAYFNGYGIGFSHGVASALAQAGIVSEDVSVSVGNCLPDSKRLFYELLSVSDERVNWKLVMFIRKTHIDRCSRTITEVLNPP